MDQNILVEQAAVLTQLLDETRVKPRAVLWVHHPDTNVWRLWITPDAAIADKREFYRIVAETISKASEKLHGLDVGTTEYVPADSPVMKGLKGFMRVDGIGSVFFNGNQFNGVYLPDGIIVRMKFD